MNRFCFWVKDFGDISFDVLDIKFVKVSDGTMAITFVDGDEVLYEDVSNIHNFWDGRDGFDGWVR